MGASTIRRAREIAYLSGAIAQFHQCILKNQKTTITNNWVGVDWINPMPIYHLFIDKVHKIWARFSNWKIQFWVREVKKAVMRILMLIILYNSPIVKFSQIYHEIFRNLKMTWKNWKKVMARMSTQKLGAQTKKCRLTCHYKSTQGSLVKPNCQKGLKSTIWRIAKAKLQTINLN